MKNKFNILTFVFVGIICLMACGEPQTEKSEKKLSKELNVYNWEGYFGDTALSDFEKKYGLKVNLETFKDEEEMISRLQSSPDKYDVIITSDESITELISLRLLAEIDLKNIPNIKNIDALYRDPFYDRGHQHSVPYLWGTTGILINRKYINETENSWSILWNPEYKGKIAMLNNPEEVMGTAFKLLRYPLNTRDSAKINEAKQKLFKQNVLLAGYFDSVTIQKKMVNNELWAAQIYSGEGAAASDQNPELKYFIPPEGSSCWIDCLAIPRDAQHQYTAEVFINYILEPDISGKIASELWYANCNKSARAYTDKSVLNNSSLYPSDDIMKKCEFFIQSDSSERERAFFNTLYETWAKLGLMKEN